jgi:hypothetical protein
MKSKIKVLLAHSNLVSCGMYGSLVNVQIMAEWSSIL